MAMTQEHVPVLIVGAGGAGLSLSLLLLQQGIHPLLIERRDDVSWVPRARNLNFRTLEVLRGLGLEAEVRTVGTRITQVIFKERLADDNQEKVIDPTPPAEHSEATSPEPFGWHFPQSRLEPLMLATARQRGGDVRYGTDLVSFIQDDAGVSATLKEHATGRSYIIRSDYMLAADGAHSRIRQTLGISSQGIGVLPEYFIFIYFHAPWKQFIAGHESDAFVIKNPDVEGIFLVADGDRGMFLTMYHPRQGESAEVFTTEHCKELLKKAIGRDIAIEIVATAPWQPAESVADQFQLGRVFLVGDAAHTMPAYKGLGVNTAIQSAQNLAWKLAAVLKGQASPLLLTTYQEERHPVGRFAAEQSLTGPGAAWLPKPDHQVLLPKEKDLPFFYPIVGYRYRSQAIVSEEDANSPPRAEITLLDRPELTGVPGTRVPHLWLERRGQRISTLDLLDGCFVLLAGPQGARWCEAAVAVKASMGIKLSAYRIGPDADLIDLEDGWSARMGVSSEGAVLLRPDGFVAWRTSVLATTPELLLEEVLVRVLCQPTRRV
jgi:putative polyketide hydroxylase